MVPADLHRPQVAKRRVSVTSGTPMHKTHLPICTWIIATYLLATSSKRISSLKLAALLGCNTARRGT